METFIHFTFNNPIGFLISFIPAIINICLLGYVFLNFVRNRVTIVFTLLTLSLACIQLNDSTSRIAANAETARAWDAFFSLPWVTIAPLTLHFTLLYTRFLNESRQIFTIVLAYFISFIFLGVYNADVYDHQFFFDELWGWVDAHNGHYMDIFSLIWMAILLLFSVAIMVINTIKLEKKSDAWYQSLLITIGISIPALISLVFQMILPSLLKINSVPITTSFLTAYSLAIAIALSKYNLFKASDLMNMEKVLDTVPTLIMVINESNMVTYVNDYTCNKLKKSKKSILFKHVNEVLQFKNIDDKFQFDYLLDRGFQGIETLNQKSILIVQNICLEILISSKPVYNNDIIQGVIVVIRDVSFINQAQRKLEISELHLRTAQKTAHVGSWEWSFVDNIVNWSDEVYEIFEIENKSIKLNYETYLNCLNDQDREIANKTIQESFKNKVPFQFYHKLKTNPKKIINCLGDVLLDSSGNVVGMYGTSQDVSQILEKEEQLENQNQELTKINSELDRFVYSVSHDLRSPLTSMQGLTQIALMENKDENIATYLKMILSSADKLDKFILDILNYSRNARLDLKTSEINLEELIKGILSQYSHTDKKEILIETNFQINAPFFSDETRLTMVLNNLISNALRYTASREETSFVHIDISSNTKEAIIVIEDNGIGIPKEIQNKVFDMFFRGNKNSVGSGLGLYIAKEAIEKMQGIIKLDSDPKKGSTFTIKIPNQNA